ncbi:hypothetical protein BZA05DRAFT_200951 [Tricharina praecox]|uniref:uncharacterized protein n=1 Tax=Tricharina praecox TaxID=43433 RepID=UPI0022201364|nr:uncharacterized protein BZA05DRAFT_200951 [Tricharina praecox]KAI5856447.1 hypothetical protein BZA05DRAFT_200951 [Tricharina praecox]
MAGPSHHYSAYDPESDQPWFVDGEGIERRVIQTDLPRYLGNGTTLRPGMGPDNRPGYWYNAYRPLTNQMIASLKADSARWLTEKRESSRKREPEPEYFQSQAWKDSRRRAAPTVTAAELPATQEPHPLRSEPPPMDSRFAVPDAYGRSHTVPHPGSHGGNGGHGGRPAYGGHVSHEPPPLNSGATNYRYEQHRYPGNPQQQQYPSHGHPHDSGPVEPPSDPYRPRQYPPPDYPGPPNPASAQQVPVEPPQRQPQQPQPDHPQYYYPPDYYRQQQQYYPPRAGD